jgi:hypothetical protein
MLKLQPSTLPRMLVRHTQATAGGDQGLKILAEIANGGKILLQRRFEGILQKA